MELENIKIDRKDHIAVITIDHPPVNAWNMATVLDFEKAVDAVENDENVRVVILTGNGEKCFSAGYEAGQNATWHEKAAEANFLAGRDGRNACESAVGRPIRHGRVC